MWCKQDQGVSSRTQEAFNKALKVLFQTLLPVSITINPLTRYATIGLSLTVTAGSWTIDTIKFHGSCHCHSRFMLLNCSSVLKNSHFISVCNRTTRSTARDSNKKWLKDLQKWLLLKSRRMLERGKLIRSEDEQRNTDGKFV